MKIVNGIPRYILIGVLLLAVISIVQLSLTLNEWSAYDNHDQQKYVTEQDIIASMDSEEQQLIGRDILLQTLRFMRLDVPDDDPELIKFVAKLIVPPSTSLRNLSTPKEHNDYSQLGQSVFVDKLLNGKRNGFFVEAGGFDGETYSNSLFFEMERNWTGILIEPSPKSFRVLKTKNRKCHAINACIAGAKPQIVKFRSFSELSGRESEMDWAHKKRIAKESHNAPPITFYVPCFSLNTILKALHVRLVDYFSLDVEGGEYDVLKALDLTNLDISTFSIEHNGHVWAVRQICRYLKERGYKFIKDNHQDIILSKMTDDRPLIFNLFNLL